MPEPGTIEQTTPHTVPETGTAPIEPVKEEIKKPVKPKK